MTLSDTIPETDPDVSTTGNDATIISEPLPELQEDPDYVPVSSEEDDDFEPLEFPALIRASETSDILLQDVGGEHCVSTEALTTPTLTRKRKVIIVIF